MTVYFARLSVLVSLALFLAGCGAAPQAGQSSVRDLLASGQRARDQHSDAACIQTFTEVLRLQAEVVSAFVGRAACYLDEGNAAAAVQDYAAAIRLSANDPDLYIGRATAEQQIGNYSQAQADLQRAASFSSANPGQLVRSAEGLGQMGFFRDAKSVLDDGIKRYPDFWDLHRYRAELQGQLGVDGDALAEFEKAVRLSSGSDLAFVLNTRAFFYMKRHQYKQAIADFTQGVAADPTQYYLLRGRAEARLAVGDSTGALNDLGTAIGMFSSPADSVSKTSLVNLLIERAQILLQLGNNAGAASDIRAALKIVPPGDSDTRARLQQLLVSSGG